MRVLVLATDTIDPDDIREALGEEAEEAEIRLVAPAVDGTWLSRLTDDHGEARAEAEAAETESTDALREAELSVSGEVGDADPLQAIEDALATFSADQIVLFMRADEDVQHVNEDIDPEDVEDRFGVPVVRLDRAG
jgi:hypothetical protein